jgi:hypothetical protein
VALCTSPNNPVNCVGANPYQPKVKPVRLCVIITWPFLILLYAIVVGALAMGLFVAALAWLAIELANLTVYLIGRAVMTWKGI